MRHDDILETTAGHYETEVNKLKGRLHNAGTVIVVADSNTVEQLDAWKIARWAFFLLWRGKWERSYRP